jgi:superfamily II DNA/RNA helicase
MNVFEVHRRIINDYARYIQSFIRIDDDEIRKTVDDELQKGKLWPEPLLQFNPAFKSAGRVADLAASGVLHRDTNDVFTGYSLWQHQLDAIQLGAAGKDFVVTSGTGSGKSLTYIGTIFSHLLANPDSKGVVAVVVYPLNALINSQTDELNRYAANYKQAKHHDLPISYGQYTGQEEEGPRERMRQSPPQILLTNYMMLELLLTRVQERSIRDAIYENLRYLVFDELHTYRGRQGADVAMLIRRIRAQCRHDVVCIGTSATMVSGGTADDRRRKVAGVASTLFGKPFEASQVVGETLAPSLDASAGPPTKQQLAAAVAAGVKPSADLAALRVHPVALWLEARAALDEADGQLLRRKPRPVDDLATLLADESGASKKGCLDALSGVLLWISTVNEAIQKQGSRDTVLPYRLHQFISQTGSVYTTLDRGVGRYITLEPGIYQKDSESKPIFPNVFSRGSGRTFICVSRSGSRLMPRELKEYVEDEETTDGYLIPGDDIWDPDTDLDELPDSWFKFTKAGRVPAKEYAERLPKRLYYDADGNCSETAPLEYEGWFMPAPLLFDPTSGTFFDAKTHESTKLATLGSEGRSTSTTITAFSILAQLREAGYSLADQKLLSFTDNRQDAALQAGHFNDFVQVVHLRSAIRKALESAADNRLTFAALGPAVFKALTLPFTHFANQEREPDLAPVRRKYEETLQQFIVYRALADLERSWRIVLPNLEQCGLLEIEYADLPEIAATDSFWQDTPVLRSLAADQRTDFLSTILDYFRLEYAIHSANYLEYDKMRQAEKEFREKLKAPWTLDENERLSNPRVLRYEPLDRKSNLASASIGPTSSLGKYIKKYVKDAALDATPVQGDHYRDFILGLCRKLADADYLHEQEAKAESGDKIPVFRLKIDRLVWTLGDGETVKTDVIKRRSYKNAALPPNVFFRDMYRRDFVTAKRLRAADHTGQLDKDDRLDREERFKCDWWLDPDTKKKRDEEKIRTQAISCLFCSPTMELGVDIGGLSVVHLRNAPPNSASYAQRSGRAGRSGQGALVFTYCSGFSAHDRHFFQEQADLVAGAVQPPRLDLANRELLLTHLNALAISEVGLPGLDSDSGSQASLKTLADIEAAAMPLRSGVREGLKIPDRTLAAIKACFRRVIADFETGFADKAPWFSESWIDASLAKLADHLDESLGRWRKLFQAAKQSRSKATTRIESGTLVATSDEYKRLVRQQNQSTRQINLLLNEMGPKSQNLSEFYPYRYLASEGFLPGYNFTRLPLRIFIESGQSAGEYISRPRAIALREFGPLNLIYHSGRKFKVHQLVLQSPEDALTDAKVSTKVGYFLTGEQKLLENCPFSGVSLADNANKDHITGLIEMQESRAEEIDRISCEEEERVSRGFEIDTFFTVENLDRVRKAVARSGDSQLLNLRYLPAARLVYVNRKWRTSPHIGFPLGMVNGFWKSKIPDPPRDAAQQQEPYRLVSLMTSNTADALYIEPIQPLGLTAAGVISLQHALKRAIEAEFQVEPAEIGVVAVGNMAAPNILIYEAAEGSLGILSRFADDPDILHRVVRQAQKICRFDDVDYKAKASYDDLLSYQNQRDHKTLDRFEIKEALEKLLACTVEVQTNSAYANYDAHYQGLLPFLDPNSTLERTFLDYLRDRGLRLPDSAQKYTPGVYSQPDFFYEPGTWLFVDGSVHDKPEVKADDAKKRGELRAQGMEVLVYRYDDDLAAFVAGRPDIFSKVR